MFYYYMIYFYIKKLNMKILYMTFALKLIYYLTANPSASIKVETTFNVSDVSLVVVESAFPLKTISLTTCLLVL